MRTTARALVTACLFALGCSGGGGHDLAVDLVTDYVPLREFRIARTDLLDERPDPSMPMRALRSAEHAARGEGDYVSGVRIAELDGLPSGTYHVRVLLIGDGGAAEGLAQIALDSDRAVTVVVTRSCRGLVCPGPGDDPSLIACVGGRCVAPECTPESPETCMSMCRTDADCAAGVACAVGRCEGGTCLSVPDSSRCGSGELCDAMLGCVEAPPDAGPPDAGAGTDAGGCPPCGDRVEGPWSGCSGYSSACDETGRRSRDVMVPTCVEGACVNDVITETESCGRNTDGDGCRSDQIGAWGPCNYEGACDETGTQSREITHFACGDGSCVVSGVDVETQACARSTEGTVCLTGGTYCGRDKECFVCRGGACVVNSPHYNASCHPSCGAASVLCGTAGLCCALGSTCGPSGATAGPGPWADCGACCAAGTCF